VNPPAAGSPDSVIVRAGARRMAWQIGVGCAIVVVLVSVLAFVLAPVLHPADLAGDDDDTVLRDALVVSGAIGVLTAGLVGFLVGRRAVAPLSEALALQRRFVADAGHELRTPLTVLHTRAQLIAARMNPADPSRPLIDRLLNDSRVLGDIVEELLDSAAFPAQPRTGELFDAADVAAEVATSLHDLAAGAGLGLHAEARGGAPVRGSRTALRRALTALVDNAISHTPAGGHVTICTEATGDGVVVTVTDTGEGLAGQDPRRLTERFARGLPPRTGDDRGRRFGLGLALVSEVAAAHGGSFTLTDAPTTGARAAIRIPTTDTRGTIHP
jgi:two-component system OmpR family sensor kinase